MSKFSEVLNSVKGYKNILKDIEHNSIIVNGILGVQRRHFAFSVSESLNRPFVFVVQNSL